MPIGATTEAVVSAPESSDAASGTSSASSIIDGPIQATILLLLGTESGIQFVAKRYKTLYNVERAAAEGRMPYST